MRGSLLSLFLLFVVLVSGAAGSAAREEGATHARASSVPSVPNHDFTSAAHRSVSPSPLVLLLGGLGVLAAVVGGAARVARKSAKNDRVLLPVSSKSLSTAVRDGGETETETDTDMTDDEEGGKVCRSPVAAARETRSHRKRRRKARKAAARAAAAAAAAAATATSSTAKKLGGATALVVSAPSPGPLVAAAKEEEEKEEESANKRRACLIADLCAPTPPPLGALFSPAHSHTNDHSFAAEDEKHESSPHDDSHENENGNEQNDREDFSDVEERKGAADGSSDSAFEDVPVGDEEELRFLLELGWSPSQEIEPLSKEEMELFLRQQDMRSP